MTLIAVIEDRSTVEKILSHLGLPTRPPPRPSPFRRQPALAFGTRCDPHEGIDPPAPND